MEASDLLNIEDTYVGDMVSPSISKKSVYVNEASKAYKLPEDMPVKEKEQRVKQYNKEVKKKIKLTTMRERPKLTDMEIALILASHAHTPLDILAHTLNLSVLRVKRVVAQYSCNAIPQMPLVMVSDTARYWDKDTIKDSNDVIKLNNPKHPLSAKELLRSARDNTKTTQTVHKREYTNHGRSHKSNILNTTYSEEQLLKVYFKYPKNTTESTTLNPYSVVVNKTKVVIGNVKNYDNLNSTLLHTMYNIVQSTENNLLISTDINSAIHRLLHVDDFKTYTVPNRLTNQIVVYNNKLHLSYYTGMYSNTLHSFSRTTTVHVKNYTHNSTHYVYVPYYYVRPHLYDRAHGEPLLTTNRELKYRVPNTLLQNPRNFIKYSKRTPEVKIVVRCNRCNTKMYTSDSKCNCHDPIIVTYKSVAKHGLNIHKPIKYPRVSMPRVSTPITPKDIKDFYRYYTKNNKTLSNRRQYQYHKNKSYDKESSSIKQVVSIYTNHDDYSILIGNIDVKLLYVNFRVPIDTTLSEPSHL